MEGRAGPKRSGRRGGRLLRRSIAQISRFVEPGLPFALRGPRTKVRRLRRTPADAGIPFPRPAPTRRGRRGRKLGGAVFHVVVAAQVITVIIKGSGVGIYPSHYDFIVSVNFEGKDILVAMALTIMFAVASDIRKSLG